MLNRFIPAVWLACVCALVGLGLTAARPAPAYSVASIVVTPSGATLKPGDTVQFSAVALDSHGVEIPGVTFTWTASSSTIGTITSGGLFTARNQGFSAVTVRGANKSLRFTVAVVKTGPYVAAGLTQVNHVLVDDDWVYWTEVSATQSRVRKTPKAGGPIFDIASEPSRDNRGVSVAYVHLRQIGDTIVFSRETLGFLEHWSIRSVSKNGGAVTTILGEDISNRSMLASGWGVSGKYVVVALAHPEKLSLPTATTYGSYNTETQTWSSLVTGQFQLGRNYVLAGNDQFIFLRGITSSFATKVLRADPSGGPNTFDEIHGSSATDSYAAETGVADADNVFFWERPGGKNRLSCQPIDGSEGVTLTSTGFGPGLNKLGEFLYWAKNGTTLERMPAEPDSKPTNLVSRLYNQSTEGPVAVDLSGVYYVHVDGPGLLSIQKAAP